MGEGVSIVDHIILKSLFVFYTVCVGRNKEPLEKYTLSRARNVDPLREEGAPPRKMLVPG
jgi:hypothetical protein